MYINQKYVKCICNQCTGLCQGCARSIPEIFDTLLSPKSRVCKGVWVLWRCNKDNKSGFCFIVNKKGVCGCTPWGRGVRGGGCIHLGICLKIHIFFCSNTILTELLYQRLEIIYSETKISFSKFQSFLNIYFYQF